VLILSGMVLKIETFLRKYISYNDNEFLYKI
jgi:hypothetical protein